MRDSSWYQLHRVLVLAPFGRDAELLCSALRSDGLAARSCSDLTELCLELQRGVGAIIIAEEHYHEEEIECLAAALGSQPEWSDPPIIVLGHEGGEGRLLEAIDTAHVTVLDRPTAIAALVTSTRAALRSRDWQYRLRDHLAERERTVDELRRLTAAKDEFLGLVSHELRTPLTTVVGLSRVLNRSLADAPEDTKESLRQLSADSERLQSLIENMLFIARLEQGEMELDPLRLIPIVEGGLNRHMARHPAREVISEYDPDVPLVLGQSVWIEQILANLLSNAEKYSRPKSPIVVRVEGDSDFVCLEVCDQGQAVQATDVERMFEAFYRGTDLPPGAPGLGLGLTVCQRLTQAMNGRIRASSPQSGGMCFTVELPAYRPSDEDA